MLYHGIDIVEVARIRQAAQRWGRRFLLRVFTEGELADCDALGSAPRYDSLAGRWAAKEAAAKALGIGLSGLGAAAFDDTGAPRPGLRDIELARDADGRPHLRLYGAAAAAASALGVASLAVSISHTRDLAVASVIAGVERSGD